MSEGYPSWLPSAYNVQQIASYPRYDLQNARSMLIFSLRNPDNYLLEQVKIKMGIPNIYGRVSQPPPIETNHSSRFDINAKGFQDLPPPHSFEQNIVRSFNVLPLPSMMQRTSTVTSQMMEQNNSAATLRKRKLENVLSDDDDDDYRCHAKKSMLKQEQKCAPQSGTSHAYRCDLCSYTAEDFHKMQGHLDNGEHSSASLYVTDGSQLLLTEQLHVVKKRKGSVTDTAFMCPNCSAVFDDMLTCAIHNKYWHRNSSGLYYPCLIKSQRTILFSIRPVCNICHVKFRDHRLLNEHWTKQPDHCPVKGDTDQSVTVLITCPYCSENFLNDFLACKFHVLQCHNNFHVTSITANISVKHLLRSTILSKVPSFNRSFDSKNGLDIEMRVLSKLWQICAKDMPATRIQRQALTSRLNELTKLYKYRKLTDEKC